MFSSLNFAFEYTNFEVEKSDLDQPLVKLNYQLKTESSENLSDLYVEIQSIKYGITLQSSESNSSSFLTELSIGEFYSPMFVKIGTVQSVFFYFSLPTKALGKIIDIPMRGRIVVLRISTEIYGKVYRLYNNYYMLSDVLEKSELIKHGHEYGITLPTHDVQRLIKDAEYTHKLRIDIPIYNYNSNVTPSIKGAIGSLQSASEQFEKGNFHDVVVNTRNAVLKTQLKDAFLAQAPTDAYKNVIDNLQDELLSVLEIIHKFIHENSDKLRMVPIREDLELIYYSVALIISYLARRL